MTDQNVLPEIAVETGRPQAVAPDEARLLLTAVAIVGGFWGLLALLNGVRDQENARLDRLVLMAFRGTGDFGTAIGPRWLRLRPSPKKGSRGPARSRTWLWGFADPRVSIPPLAPSEPMTAVRPRVHKSAGARGRGSG